MMRLIDADAFLERTSKDPLFPLVERYGLSSVIQHEPTVDAVPVVRCRECKYLRFTGTVWRCVNVIVGMICEPDDYCSRGEKSETFKVR